MFPKNALNCYTTQLKEPIYLNDKYEVALVELMYPVNWKFKNYAKCYVIVRNSLHDFEKKYTISFDVMDSISQILDKLNFDFEVDGVGVVFEYDRGIKRISITLDANFELEFENDFQYELGFRASIFQFFLFRVITLCSTVK